MRAHQWDIKIYIYCFIVPTTQEYSNDYILRASMWAALATSSSFTMSAESNTVMCIGATYYKNTTTAAAAAATTTEQKSIINK